jgi:hypothetical protein
MRRGDGNGENLVTDSASVKTKLGICAFAPHHADSRRWQEKVEAGK